MRYARWLGYAVFATVSAPLALAEPEVIEREAELVALAPAAAWEGVGGWDAPGYWIATGHSITIDSLGVAKGKRTEREIAADDARTQLAKAAAAKEVRDFDPELFDVDAELRGLRTAAVFRLPHREGLFLIAVVPKNEMHVRATFAPVKARQHAIALFGGEDFVGASRAFSVLTTRGVQDPETIAFARAASARVNLAAGASGESRRQFLETLARFHETRSEWEAGLQCWNDLYRETEQPDRPLLERLAALADRTHRPNSAAAFRREIERRWPSSEKQ